MAKNHVSVMKNSLRHTHSHIHANANKDTHTQREREREREKVRRRRGKVHRKIKKRMCCEIFL
jgi:hypothetical protein